nr:protein RRP6-like 3 isoform X1 [Ipomoea trifida]
MAQPIKGPCKIVRRQNPPKPPYQTPKISHSQIKNKQSASDRIADTNPFDAMENRDKVKLALKLTIATCITVAVSIFVASKLHNHRKRSRRKTSPSPCYLKSESKPQYTFKRVLADNSYSSFKHLKLNATNTSTSEECVNLHPYKAEISALLKEPNVEVLELFNENLEELTSRDSYVWVETESQLQELAEVLSGERAFAVDTEQHSLRSFLGFTCLIQISTKREDYLVDTIALHDMMGILRPIFANPEICKVFHGADNDVLWLQRDFHIYVVNLFDTAKACDVLSKPQRSLAYLLEAYCGVVTNKQLQREDWRQRPLPAEMVLYAQNDAHYLLYIAHCLFTELKQKDSENSSHLNDKFNFVLEATRRANTTCLQLFSKELEAYPGDSAASSIISRYQHDQGNLPSSSFDKKFQDLVRQLCAWRDIMARVHDESLRYVLSEHAIVALASKAPTEVRDICNTVSEADANGDHVTPFQSLSPLVCSHLEDFNHLFQDEIGDDDENLLLILQKCLGANGSCPLSIYNYALLSKTSLKVANRSVVKKNGFKTARCVARKASRELFVQKFSCKSPVYHNCRIYANDGRLLCYCDRRKLEWYVNRNLAKLVEEEPPAIMLLFEPKGRPEDEDNDFYIQSKKNICVSCGEGNHYLRYRIIPSCYRMHFPEHLKSHRSHDIVLLCVDCHEIAHAAAEKYKKEVAAEFGIPLFVRKVFDSSQMQNTSASNANIEEDGVPPLQLRTAAMALLRHGSRMPSRRREELEEIVRNYYGGREITEGDLEKALLIGMSPHERRRFEKKKKLASKQPTTDVGSDDNQEPSSDAKAEFAPTDELLNRTESCCNKEDTNTVVLTEMDIDNQSLPSNAEVNCEVPVANGKDLTNKSEFSVSGHISDPDSIIAENGNISSESGLVQSNNDVNLKQHPKLSLLGHGPHGKQVVEFILKEHGEEGVSEFCQRWRQVFVEALQPRFLPGGWNVMHRLESSRIFLIVIQHSHNCFQYDRTL